MILQVLLISLSVFALQELDPISEAETHDEVAQAQERSVWIACLFLAYSHIEVSSETLKSLHQEIHHPLSEVKRKVSATILEKCSNSITHKEAEEILSTNIEDGKYDHFSAMSLENFDVTLTDKQKELISKIEKFIHEKPEDLFPPPPKTQGVPLYQEEQNYWWALALLGILPIGWLLRPKNKAVKAEEVAKGGKAEEKKKKKKN